MEPSEIESGLDYTKQHKYTRFHDICIRNVLRSHGWELSGKELLKIRCDADASDWASENFDPGKVVFHDVFLIRNPRISGWWDVDSVEDFYQSNKIIAAKK